jgi:ribosomal protein S27AE
MENKRVLAEEREMDIIKALELKEAIKPCPRCGTPEFEILGETTIPLMVYDLNGTSRGSRAELPILVSSCTRCGYLAFHALGLLGLKR